MTNNNHDERHALRGSARLLLATLAFIACDVGDSDPPEPSAAALATLDGEPRSEQFDALIAQVRRNREHLERLEARIRTLDPEEGGPGEGASRVDPPDPTGGAGNDEAARPAPVSPTDEMSKLFDSAPVQWLMESEAQDRTLKLKEVKALDERLAEVQAHIKAGEWVEAETKLADIHWTPVLSRSAENQRMTKNYDAKREALEKVIDKYATSGAGGP